MKKLLLYIFLFFYGILWSQQKNIFTVDKNTFSSRDGYVISTPYHSIYDNDGWLWILGEDTHSNEYVIGGKEVVIQRFDGANFFTLKLPVIKKESIDKGYFFKAQKKGMYLMLTLKKGKRKLFFIDTKTLKITPVKKFNEINFQFWDPQLYAANNSTKLMLTSKKKLYSVALHKTTFKFIDSLAFNAPISNPFLEGVIVADSFSIVKLKFHKKIYTLNFEGKITQKMSKNNFLDQKGLPFFPNRIANYVKDKNGSYFYFDDIKNAFKYSSKRNKFIEIPNSYKEYEKRNLFVFNEKKTNAFKLENDGDDVKIKLYDVEDENKLKLFTEIKFNRFSGFISKNIGKDVMIFNGNNLDAYTFKSTKIKTFLKGKSTRTIKHFKESTYIVSTDNQGVYLVDVEKGTEKKIKFLSDGKEFSMVYNRDIFIGKNHTVLMNDSHHLHTLDSTFHIIAGKTIPIAGEEIIKVGDTLFTSETRGTIYKYSLSSKKRIKIANTKTIGVKEFTTDGKKVFATTTKGIFEYENGTYNTYEFENEKTENFLSIKYLKNYGVLVSTKFGKVYKYNTSSKKLALFYADELKASIVGMLEDNEANLWLNTYVGITSINQLTNKVVKYTHKDGVYELEGNRYSTYKDAKGNVFIGSYKGLSFFNPKELIEKNLNLQPKFTSISFFDTQQNRWKKHTSLNYLETVKEIKLPAEYRRFSATMSVFNQVNPKDIRYRYRLIDAANNSEWFTSFSGNEILFANLEAGKYTLQIEAIDLHQKKIGERIELIVISELVFYKTWWFLVALSILILSVLWYFFYQYKERQSLSAKNEIALKEAQVKSAMMLEIHHRIKNNLQIVSGLLGLQMINSENDELKEKLQDSQNRIESIAGIHNELYSAEKGSDISVHDSIQNSTRYYKTLFPAKIKYHLNIANVTLSIDKATPLILLFNELVNNSNKHAFKGIESPEIHVNFIKKEDEYFFEYFDNGNFTKKETNSSSMGMRIVEMMNKQLKGSMKIEEANGFKLTLQFK